jgi:hypothetical protein
VGNIIFHVQGDVGTSSYPDAMTEHKNLAKQRRRSVRGKITC